MTDRAAFLDRIRSEMARARGVGGAAQRGELAPRPARPREIAETLRRELAERWRETLEKFRVEFERVAGVYHRVASVDDVPDVIGAIARERDSRRAIAWHPAALGVDWRSALSTHGLTTVAMPAAGVESAVERQALRDLIAAADIGVTGVDLAVAETGSLVLRSGSGRPRSTSLLPPYHVAVFDRHALVESLAQAGIFLEAWHEVSSEGREDASGRGGVINFITGPSRTADIELTLTRGVHGPKEVHAIFVEGGLGG
ncbi:MAG TPA: lactate utilization protein [Candidatus Acidoferrum sp.]|nr:lactate utilization protein [Candidatus Acidoferrum sp.]